MTERDSSADTYIKRNRLGRRQRGNEQEIDEDDKNSAIDTMVDWFNEQFEDPANDTPWDGEDKAYVYVFGGPFEARDVVWGQFNDHFPEEWVNDATAEIEKDGIFEWAPKASGDYYEHPDDDEDLTDTVEGLRQSAIEQLKSRLNDLEKQMAELPVSPSKLGHNMPPEEIGLPPYNDEVRYEIELQIELVRREINSDSPSSETMVASESYFRKSAQLFLEWTGKKLDLAVDEAIKSGIKAATWTGFAATMLGVADQISTLLGLIF